jgi:hypothetical protein
MKKPVIHAMMIMTLLAGIVYGCNKPPEAKAKAQGQEIWFGELIHDYGEIARDSDGTWSFVFKNLGKEAIVINRVRSTCGCTIPAWPKEPVAPGTSGEITVKYNTAQTGSFLKSVFVYSSASNSPVKLQVKGRVVSTE